MSTDPASSEERDTEERGDGVEPTLGVADAGVADLHVLLLHHEAAGGLFLQLSLPHQLG